MPDGFSASPRHRRSAVARMSGKDSLMNARWLVVALAMLLVAACSPFGDESDAAGPDPTATRVVAMATFTATEVVPPAEATATAQAQATAGAATATAVAAIPTPTPGEIPESDLLTPPQARLIIGGEQHEGAMGSYSWQFDDEAGSFVVIQAPAVPLGDELAIQAGEQLALEIYGSAYRTPPQVIEVLAYDYESNRGTPVNPQTGQPADEEAFAVRTAPEMQMVLESADGPFTLEGIEPGHYALWIQGQWGTHPAIPSQPIFVTWLFNIVVT